MSTPVPAPKGKSEIRSTNEAPRTETNRSQLNPKPKKIQNAESKLKSFGILCSFESLRVNSQQLAANPLGPSLRLFEFVSDFVLRIFSIEFRIWERSRLALRQYVIARPFPASWAPAKAMARNTAFTIARTCFGFFLIVSSRTARPESGSF